MGTFSIWHWLIVLAVVIILFGGGGKLSRLMGDMGKGLKSFKRNLSDEEASASDDEKKPIEASKSAATSSSDRESAVNR
ncbi:MAG: twin-arginine translocase TatA/TatE family subunit [Alphaproteobacteria bacterium]